MKASRQRQLLATRALPLFTHERPEAVLAWYQGKPVTAGQFLSAASALAAQLPQEGSYLLNLCRDRYHFTLALAAGLLRGRCSLLAPSQAPEVLRQLQSFAPHVVCVTDGVADEPPGANLAMPTLKVDSAAQPGSLWPPPDIPGEQPAAVIFTSGSTGKPVPHAKSFGELVHGVRAGAERLTAVSRGGCAILGTVPQQHMYGVECTVLMPLQSAGVLVAEQPLFPADIATALQRLPCPRMLCTTPVHLRALVESDIVLPPLDLILSATAALSAELARQAESRFGAPVLEIYGSTETGQMASRRTTHDPVWHLWPQVRLSLREGRWWAQGGHLSELTPLADVLECVDESRFILHGRTTDLVNVAGKRSSLAYLSYRLNAIPGVRDGAFFIRTDAPASRAGVTRLAAFAVAPELSAAHILAALREHIDPVFLPRPLLLIEELPRNATGKLPQQALHTLASQLAAGTPGLFD